MKRFIDMINFTGSSNFNGSPAQTRQFVVPVLIAVLAAISVSNVQGSHRVNRTQTELLTGGSCDGTSAQSPAPTTTDTPTSLSKQMQAAVAHLSKRYLLSDSATEEVVRAAYAAGAAERINPLLVLSVIAVESGFNPFAESVMGAKGLMQVIPKYHPEKFADAADDFSVLVPRNNILAGTRVISEYLRGAGGDMTLALQRYAGAGQDSTARYANKVYAELARLQKAISPSSTLSGSSLTRKTTAVTPS